MIPWLLVAQIVSISGKPLSKLVDDCMANFPASGEINLKVADASAAIAAITEKYKPTAASVDTTDGISMEFGDWRFNLRSSNTEPVIRLNVESRGNAALMQQKLGELLGLLDSMV